MKRHVCPECKKKFKTARGMGSHRRHRHGIAGSARSTTHSNKTKPVSHNQLAVIAAESEVENAVSFQEAIDIAHAVGEVEGLLLCLARQHGYPAKQFARRCADHLLIAARG